MPKISALPALSTVPAGAVIPVVSGGVTYRVTREALISGLYGSNGFPYTFSATTTDADPGAGTFRFDSGTIGSIAKLFIDLSAYAGGDVSDFLASLDDAMGTIKGFLWYRSLTDPTKWAQFKYTSRTAGSGYDKFDITLVDSGTGGLPTTTAGDTILTFDAAPSGSETVTVTTSTLTISVAHLGKSLECTNAAGCNITVPENILAKDEWFEAYATVTGQQITFTQGTNVVINKPPSLNRKTREAYSVARCKCTALGATDTFLLVGDLEVT